MSGLNELIEPLFKATSENKVQWSIEGETMVSTRQGLNLLEIVWTGQTLRFTIRNKDGIELDQKDYHPRSNEGELLVEIFQKVKRRALGADEAIQEIKQKLLALGG